VTLKAGERFASAAELSDLWLKAAEATATAIHRSNDSDHSVSIAESHAQAAEQLETAIHGQVAPVLN
jgi:hypothetical protein